MISGTTPFGSRADGHCAFEFPRLSVTCSNACAETGYNESAPYRVVEESKGSMVALWLLPLLIWVRRRCFWRELPEGRRDPLFELVEVHLEVHG